MAKDSSTQTCNISESANNELNLEAEFDQEAEIALAHKTRECKDAGEKMQYYVDTMRRNFYRKLDEMGFEPS